MHSNVLFQIFEITQRGHETTSRAFEITTASKLKIREIIIKDLEEQIDALNVNLQKANDAIKDIY